MLVPHEPTLDPRVKYTSASLAKEHKLVVVATVRKSEKRPEQQVANDLNHETIRLDHNNYHDSAMLLQFLRFVMGRSLESKFDLRSTFALTTFFALFAMVAVPFALMVGILEILMLPFVAFGRGADMLNSRVLTIVPAIVSRLHRISSVFPPLARLPDDRLSVIWSIFRFIFGVNGTLQAYLKARGWAPRTIYCHDLYTLQTAVLLKRKLGCSIIYDSHEYYPDQYADRLFAFLVRFYESRLIRAVDVYITVSPQLANELQQLYGVPSIHVLPNVEPQPSETVRPLKTRMSALAEDRLKVLYQGTFASDRGLEEVLVEWQAIDVKSAALFLRGPPNEARDRLEQLARQYGLLDSCIFILDPVIEADLIAGAAEADVGLIPYKTDRLAYRFACPNKLSQYIHGGLAVATNRLPFVESLVMEAKAGVCYDIKVPGSLARAIGSLASDRTLLASSKKAARWLSSSSYNWERYETTLLRLSYHSDSR